MTQEMVPQFVCQRKILSSLVLDCLVDHDVPLPVICTGKRTHKVNIVGCDLPVLDILRRQDLLQDFVAVPSFEILGQHFICTQFNFSICHRHPLRRRFLSWSAYQYRRVRRYPDSATMQQISGRYHFLKQRELPWLVRPRHPQP